MYPVLVAALLLAVFAPMANAEESADDVLSRMVQTYGALQSYTDTGVVLLHQTADEEPYETTFETAFARPNLFRFAWVSHHPYPPLRHVEWRSVIWSDGTAAFARYGFGPGPSETKAQDSLTLAIAGATGVSGGSAHTVPRLLMPETGGVSVAELKSSTLAGVETIEGTRCFHIVGAIPRIGPIDLWVGTGDHLLRKLQMRLGGILQEEIHREIRLNESIPLASFSSQ